MDPAEGTLVTASGIIRPCVVEYVAAWTVYLSMMQPMQQQEVIVVVKHIRIERVFCSVLFTLPSLPPSYGPCKKVVIVTRQLTFWSCFPIHYIVSNTTTVTMT